MKKINVTVKEKTILELQEDAKAGDIIDLKELVEVDTSYIDSIIKSGKDEVYNSKLKEFEEKISAQNELKLQELKNTIKQLEESNKTNISLKEKELETKYKETILNLQNEINSEKEKSKNDLSNKEKDITLKYKEEITNLKNIITNITKSKELELENIKVQYENDKNTIIAKSNSNYKDLENKYNNLLQSKEQELSNNKLIIENQYLKQIEDLKNEKELIKVNHLNEINSLKSSYELDITNKLNDLNNKYKEELQIKDNKILQLQNQKSMLNVKQLGESLESLCDNEVRSYMQNGLFNCIWEKDNDSIKLEGESKGSKADFIFKVYADQNHNQNEEIASVCLDMKDESPDTKTKQTNQHYYNQLDINRKKKNCKYAVLVSNLELDKPSILPIYKVIEYENMYVVRPAYLMTFLNMVASLSSRFSDLLLSNNKETLLLKDKTDLINEFDSLKSTYLDKPLESLEKNIQSILKSSDTIRKAATEIDSTCDKITTNFINKMQDKIDKFELKLNKSIIKKLD